MNTSTTNPASAPISLAGLARKRKAQDDDEQSAQTVKTRPTKKLKTNTRKPKPKPAKALAPIPTTIPQAAFKIQPLPKVTPWNEASATPTEVLAADSPSPVNWEYISSKRSELRKEDTATWDSRQAWKPKGQQPDWSKLGEAAGLSHEAMRKRFKKAALALFELTGVYFGNTACGLENYGISNETMRQAAKRVGAKAVPTGLVLARNTDEGYVTHSKRGNSTENGDQDHVVHADARGNAKQTAPNRIRPCAIVSETTQESDIENLDSRQPKDRILDTVEFILQPPPTLHGDRCEVCCKAGLCYDKACSDSKDCCKTCCSNGCDCPCDHPENWSKPSHSRERWTAHLKKEGAPFGCPDKRHQSLVTRDVEPVLIQPFCKRPLTETNLLRVESNVFDIFTNCLAPTLREEMPRQLKCLESWRVSENTEQLEFAYRDVPFDFTLGDIFKVYCCSQALECSHVSNLILRHLLKIIEEEENLVEGYRSGRIPMNVRVEKPRILNFEPEDVNYLFANTKANDPIRLLLLDIITYKGDHGQMKIAADEEEFCAEFLKFVNMRVHKRKSDELAHAMTALEYLQETQSTLQGAEIPLSRVVAQMGPVEESVTRLQSEVHQIASHIDDLATRATDHTKGDGLVGDWTNEWVYRRMRADWSWEEEPSDTIWEGYHFRGWLPNATPSADGFSKAELEQRMVQFETFDCLRTKDKATFDHAYGIDVLSDDSQTRAEQVQTIDMSQIDPQLLLEGHENDQF
jgi:hypothetical protein